LSVFHEPQLLQRNVTTLTGGWASSGRHSTTNRARHDWHFVACRMTVTVNQEADGNQPLGR